MTEASGDELLGMRLARDRVPGVNDRYVKRDLVGPLARFSPIRQAGNLLIETNGTPPPGQTGESALIAGGDGGGSNSPSISSSLTWKFGRSLTRTVSFPESKY